MISSSDILHSKILIVDDQQANIVLLERMLRGAGYDAVSSVRNPREVCELHRHHRFDLILLDLEMPDLDGFQVMEALKEIEPQDWLQDLNQTYQFQMNEGLKETAPGGYLPVIVITAHPDYKLRALQAGARDFVGKPFELAEVLARVRNMLEVRLLYLEMKNYVRALEQKIQEVVVSRNLIRRQSDEVKRLYDQIVLLGGDTTPRAPQPEAPRQYTLLYAGNDPADLQLVEQAVARRPDMRLLPASNGIDVIGAARAAMPDVILIDIDLPGHDGFEALKKLHADPATVHIPAIALGSHAAPHAIRQALEAGFLRRLGKPPKADELLEALDIALQFAGKDAARPG